jgi:hypothetical protein
MTSEEPITLDIFPGQSVKVPSVEHFRNMDPREKENGEATEERPNHFPMRRGPRSSQAKLNCQQFSLDELAIDGKKTVDLKQSEKYQ